MIARKIQYNIDYTHILTFKENYRSIVYPEFGRDNVQYAIDGEGTPLESIRMIFPAEDYIINLRRDGMSLIYEGEISQFIKEKVVIDTFIGLYEKVKRIKEYVKTARQRITIDFVEFREKQEIDKELENNSFIHSPLRNLIEFAITMDLIRDQKEIKIQFGNFSEKDIAKFAISPLSTEFNKALKDKIGYMALVNVQEETGTTSATKIKELAAFAEAIVNEYYKPK